MRINLLEELLTVKNLGSDNKPLFKRPVDIVRAVMPEIHPTVSEGSDDYTKKFNALKVNLSQLLKGNRPASDKLLNAIKSVVAQKLNPLENSSEILSLIEEEVNKVSTKIYPTPDIDAELEELNNRIKTAKSQIIFSSRPVETFDNDKSKQITDSFLKNLGILENPFDISKNYIFFEYHFPLEGIALEFYERLFRRTKLKLANSVSDAEIEKRFEQVNEKHFKVYVVDEINCVFPHSIFNYDNTNPGGFVLFTQGESNFSVAKMSQAGLLRWYNVIYSKAKMARTEVLFKDIKTKIKK